jgi:hypothetical protein
VSAQRLTTAAVAGPDAPGIRARLDGYVSDVLALPHAEALAGLSIFEMAIEVGSHLEREALGIAPGPRPSRRAIPWHLAVVPEVPRPGGGTS